MANISMKRALLSATVALAASLTMAGPAGAQYHQGSQAMYNYNYYTDATHTEWVGYASDVCTVYGVYRNLTQGYETNYAETDLTAYCVNGQLQLEP